jgi:geranylgeranyl pyrophosphate synthase
MILAANRVDLKTDRSFVDDYLHQLVCTDPIRGEGPVQQAMRYAVFGGGQRIRPILSLRIARMLGVPAFATLRAAASVELIHCASLIIDDLPCMDDSPTRRNKPAVHVRFGEATAVLAAFGLVSLSARVVVEQECEPCTRTQVHAFQLDLLRSLDCSGLIDGQALDLQLDGRSHRRTCQAVIELKTVPLFQLAVSAGSLCFDLDENERALLKCFGREFGLAFQMTDDLADGEEIKIRELEDKLATLRAAIAPFGGRRQELEELVDYLNNRVADALGE